MTPRSPVQPLAADPLDTDERRALDLVRLFGTVGALFLALGSLGAGAAPVVNPVQEIPVLRLFIRIPTVSLAVAFTGICMMVIGWLLLGRFTRPGRLRLASRAQLNRTLVMWLTPLLFIPPLFSRDVYSYIAQSEIVHRGMDPFSIGPAQALGVGDELTSAVSGMWRETPAPYGPLVLKIGSWLSSVIGSDVVTGVLMHRAVALVGVALIVWALPRLARRFGVQPVTALWLGAANPLLIFHFVAGAHNDALAIGLMMVGLELGIRRLPIRVKGDTPPPRAKGEWLFILLGVAVITLGVAVKLPAILALPFLTVMVARRWHGRLKDLFQSALPMVGVFAVVLVAACLGTGLGFGWIGAAAGTPGLVRSWISPTAELANLGGILGIVLGLGNHTNALVPIMSTLGYAVGGAITLKFLWDSFKWRYRPIIGLGVSLGAVMILQISLQPWYVLWAVIPLAAAAGTSRFRVAATILSAVLVFPTPPTGSTFDGRSYVLPQAYFAGGVVVLLAVLLLHRAAPMLLRRARPVTKPVPRKPA
nr:polyprenol phosphomannose-dependent alpha 1,6 mannosyltransferase MptB [Amycolatopsis nigrescens]